MPLDHLNTLHPRDLVLQQRIIIDDSHLYNRDWLCPQCVAEGNLVMLAVIGKKKYANQIYYQVIWQGHDEPSWQAFAEIPDGSRDLVNHYNRTNKRLAQL